MSRKIKLEKITEQYPLYSRLLAQQIETHQKLPDFSNEKSLFIMSDYGGEHEAADFYTYSFLITPPDRLFEFKKKSAEMRQSLGLDNPFKEFSYKDLQSTRVKKALDCYLEISNNLISGILVTISIEKNIQSIFGKVKRETQGQIRKILLDNQLGDWKGPVAEKLFRICHAIAIYLALLSKSGQKILWMSDHDSINADGNKRDFKDTQKIFLKILQMYTDNKYDINGFAKSFEKDPFTHDLLSLTDFSAGGIQEVFQSKIKGRNNNANEEKQKIIKWLGTPSSKLFKDNFVFTKNEDFFDIGKAELTVQI